MSKNKKKVGMIHFLSASLLFFVSSVVIFVNEFTDFFVNMGMNISVGANVVAWTGIALAGTWYVMLVTWERFG